MACRIYNTKDRLFVVSIAGQLSLTDQPDVKFLGFRV